MKMLETNSNKIVRIKEQNCRCNIMPLSADHCRLILTLRQTSEIDADQFTDSRLLHRYPIYYINRAHRCFIMGNNDELRIFAELADHVGELSHICIVQGCIYFIQY